MLLFFGMNAMKKFLSMFFSFVCILDFTAFGCCRVAAAELFTGSQPWVLVTSSPSHTFTITSRGPDTDQYLTVLDAATGDIISSTGLSEILGSYYNVGGLAIVPEDAFKQ